METIIFIYGLSIIIAIILLYFDEENETNRDFLKSTKYAFIPVINIIVIFICVVVFIYDKVIKSEKINSFLNKKIKR